ncbi:MAG: GTPase Era [Lysobacterales bacterium]|jgi:GTP-binding protein Era|nr:MAG: GTPase Era [Xanthomonadales bacterium]
MSAVTDAEPGHRAGLIAVIGRPNVGKSSLVNALVGEAVSIVAPRPQTTRHRILAIHSTPRAQFVYVDTPGLHDRRTRALDRQLLRVARGALEGVQAVLFVVEALRFGPDDERALAVAASAGVPILAVINKIDRVPDRKRLLPFIAELAKRHPFAALIPVSARRAEGLRFIEEELLKLLPECEALYPQDWFTDRSERFLVAERIREQLMIRLRDELPYGCAVEIESFEEGDEAVRIAAVIWVERERHKGMVIGAGGRMLKEIGIAARRSIERLLGRRTHLSLWCKVREDWADDERALRMLGYAE